MEQQYKVELEIVVTVKVKYMAGNIDQDKAEKLAGIALQTLQKDLDGKNLYYEGSRLINCNELEFVYSEFLSD